MFRHHSIHAFTILSPDGRTLKQIDQTFKENYINALDIQSFRGTDSDISHYLIFAEVRERLAV
jgi:hypothetical protein